MKKLLSVLTSVALTSGVVGNVAACTVRTQALKILINKDAETKIAEYDSNIKKGVLADGVFQLMNAITYTDTKYQDADKRNEVKKVLGERGLSLSLDEVFAAKIDQTDVEKEFWTSYKAARNTNFTDFSFNSDEMGTYKIGEIKPIEQTVTSDASSSEKVVTYSDFKVQEKTLSEFATEDDTKSLFSKFKFDDIKIFGFNGANQLSNSDETVSKTEEFNLQEVTDSFQLNIKENKELNLDTLYYSTVGLKDFNITFKDPMDGKNPELVYDIKYSNMTGMIIKWQLAGVTLKSETTDKVTTSRNVYWFEPTKYQFSKKLVANSGTTDMFSDINADFEVKIEKKV